MKKFLIALWLSLVSVPAFAGVSCTLPYNLQNGTTADATQVMANYNALVTCLTNAASAGNNHDITALLGLTTPIVPASGGTPVFLGGTSTGSSNGYVIASTTPSSFALTPGYGVVFIANFANTGAATLNVAGTGALNIYKETTSGPAALVAGDIQTNQLLVARYDGTEYQMTTPSTLASLSQTNQVLSGGATVVSYNGGSQSSGGTYTVNCGNGPLQYIGNAGPFTIAAPANDGSCQILITNSGTAGAVSYSGFTVGSNVGDALDTVNGHHFIISTSRIAGVATYYQKALQ